MRKQKYQKNEVTLPENCIKERFTVLEVDNIDRSEESLSGELTLFRMGGGEGGRGGKKVPLPVFPCNFYKRGN